MRIAEPTVERLVLYARLLKRLQEEGVDVISSQEIGDELGLKASQVRKDLSYFGEIGKRGVGYSVPRLCEHLQAILSPPRVWKIAMVGVGRLGGALLGYGPLQNEKFKMVALFDVDPAKVGRTFRGAPCFHIDRIADVVAELAIEVLILTVPAEAAQSVVDRIASPSFVKGILNFAPAPIVVPKEILVYNVDISVELEKLLFYLKQRESQSAHFVLE